MYQLIGNIITRNRAILKLQEVCPWINSHSKRGPISCFADLEGNSSCQTWEKDCILIFSDCFGLVLNQSENGKYNLVSVWFNKISEKNLRETWISCLTWKTLTSRLKNVKSLVSEFHASGHNRRPIECPPPLKPSDTIVMCCCPRNFRESTYEFPRNPHMDLIIYPIMLVN